MNNTVFRKIMENLSNHKDIELVATERGKTCLVPEPNHYSTKFFTKGYSPYKWKKQRYLWQLFILINLSI